MDWLKRKLRGWLIPEVGEIGLFMRDIAKAKRELHLVGKNIIFKEPVVFLGSLSNCSVDVKPTLKPEITLAKLDMPGLISSGNNQCIASCFFYQEPTAVKYQKK